MVCSNRYFEFVQSDDHPLKRSADEKSEYSSLLSAFGPIPSNRIQSFLNIVYKQDSVNQEIVLAFNSKTIDLWEDYWGRFERQKSIGEVKQKLIHMKRLANKKTSE